MQSATIVSATDVLFRVAVPTRMVVVVWVVEAGTECRVVVGARRLVVRSGLLVAEKLFGIGELPLPRGGHFQVLLVWLPISCLPFRTRPPAFLQTETES